MGPGTAASPLPIPGLNSSEYKLALAKFGSMVNRTLLNQSRQPKPPLKGHASSPRLVSHRPPRHTRRPFFSRARFPPLDLALDGLPFSYLEGVAFPFFWAAPAADWRAGGSGGSPPLALMGVLSGCRTKRAMLSRFC